ncbi:hypothetical protein HS125_11385 [bacterium]|nr:hypothetical protein [bacterium]
MGDTFNKNNDGHNRRPPVSGGPVPFGAMPPGGMKNTRIEAHTFPDGAVVEFRYIKSSRFDAEGILEVTERTEVFPPLADGTSPKDVSEIVQCKGCRELVSRSNSLNCHACRETYCRRHAVEITLEDQTIALCAACAAPVQKDTWWARLRDFLLEGK